MVVSHVHFQKIMTPKASFASHAHKWIFLYVNQVFGQMRFKFIASFSRFTTNRTPKIGQNQI